MKKKLEKLDRLEKAVLEKWESTVKGIVDKALPTDAGVVEFYLEGQDIGVRIFFSERDENLLRRIEVTRINTMNYICNYLYCKYEKQVVIGRPKGFIEKLDISEDLYEDIDKYYEIESEYLEEYTKVSKEAEQRFRELVAKKENY